MLSSAGDFMFVSVGHTDPADELFLPCPSHPQGHFTALRLRKAFFSAFFCWFRRNWLINIELKEPLGSGIIDINLITNIMGYVRASHADQ